MILFSTAPVSGETIILEYNEPAYPSFPGEIGISTNKLPPRGPVGIEQLTSYKYVVLGKGTIRS